MRDNFDAFRYSTENLIGAINLALETNPRSILPVAYLQLGASGLVCRKFPHGRHNVI